MPPPHELNAHVDELIKSCICAMSASPGQHFGPTLPSHWLTRQADAPHALWIDIARQLFCGHWASDDIGCVLECAGQIRRGQRAGSLFGQRPHSSLAPEHVLLLAAQANGWENKSQVLEPVCLQDRLLAAVLQNATNANAHGPQRLDSLELNQMLVYGDGPVPRSRLLALRLQAIDSTTVDTESCERDAGRLIADVGACLIGLDVEFQRGLQEVQALLSAALLPQAPGAAAIPAIAWNIDLLPLAGDAVQAVHVLQGPSATAAIAYGALHLLQRHLNTQLPLVEELAHNLLIIEDPASVSITAQFKPWTGLDQGWPSLHGVGGAAEKLAGLDSQLPTGRQVAHRFVADDQRQLSHAPIDAHTAADIGDLVGQIADLTSQLGPDARQIQAALLALPDEQAPSDPATTAAMQRLAASSAPGMGVRAHLLWRYAQLCAGQPHPFGNVAQLGQHFVQLTVEGPRGHGTEPTQSLQTQQNANERGSQSLMRPSLRSIFYPDDPQDRGRWRAVPAWCILAPPFSGKTTLLHHWELVCIRTALRAQRQTGQWGEVPVFLPMNVFARHSDDAAPASSPLTAEALGQALARHARREAPALPWSELLPSPGPTSHQLGTPRRDGLRVRLCIDALNEYRTGQANERDAIAQLCEWLAPRCDPLAPGALLPPVFSVRREEKGNFALRLASRPHWHAHEITIQAWGPSQMRAYVLQRRLPPAAQARLLAALGLPGPGASEDALRSADAMGLATPMAKFCAVPGFLSAQCTLLAHWPHLHPSERRADVMLALAWYCLDRWRSSGEFAGLRARTGTDPTLAAVVQWLLPEGALTVLNSLSAPETYAEPPSLRWRPGEAGGLFEGLTRVAEAMQGAVGGAREAAPWREAAVPGEPPLAQVIASVMPIQQPELPELWLEQANASGLALRTLQAQPGEMPLPWLRFIHQQIQEFFSALSVRPHTLPDLNPPALHPTTKALGRLLRRDDSKLELPPVTSHTERLRYAADLAPQREAERLITAVLAQGNLALAAQLAIDLHARLERAADRSGHTVSHGHWFPGRCHPLLQHLRARLLLASVDTGAAYRAQLHASGILSGIADAAHALPEPWRSHWAPLLPALRDLATPPPNGPLAPGWPSPFGESVDLRLRLQAGLLLGELGDNIRYERVQVLVDGRERIGIRLKAAHWARIPASGQSVDHWIGDKRNSDSQPVWRVPDGALGETRFAHSPAVVMQWQAYADDLRARGEAAPELWAMNQQRFNNPLQPITSVNWFQAQAFTAWAAPLHQDLFPNWVGEPPGQPPELGLPTEVQHEAAVRYEPGRKQGKAQALWAHDALDRREPEDMPPDLFNHANTRWGAPAPVGVFSAAWTSSGIEVMGNVWTWCSSSYTPDYAAKHRTMVMRALSPDVVKEGLKEESHPTLALRGGSFSSAAGLALAACRLHIAPGLDSHLIGLRWQMSRPIIER